MKRDHNLPVGTGTGYFYLFTTVGQLLQLSLFVPTVLTGIGTPITTTTTIDDYLSIFLCLICFPFIF
jgi:hypothetical protein